MQSIGKRDRRSADHSATVGILTIRGSVCSLILSKNMMKGDLLHDVLLEKETEWLFDHCTQINDTFKIIKRKEGVYYSVEEKNHKGRMDTTEGRLHSEEKEAIIEFILSED